jgi:uncharacterized protein YdaU (DUF1376 family)
LSRPAPYPADTLARGWRFEVDMERFKRSDTWKLAKTGTVRAALLLLWAEAWQESPCGTLPNDDELIALTIDMPAATFAKHRSVLMRGWSLADDGRLYHDIITDRVLAMLEKRAKDAKRAADNRARQAAKKVSPTEVTGASRVTHAGVRPEFDTKHKAPEEENSEANASAAGAAPGPVDNLKAKTPEELTKAELWEAGKSLLLSAGVPKGQCGTFVGKLVKDYGDQVVIEAVRAAVVATPADPREYLKAACMRLKGGRKDTPSSLTVESKAAEHTLEHLRRQAEHDALAVPPPAEVLAKLNRLKRGQEAGADA